MNHLDFFNVIGMMGRSEVHKNWTVSDIERLIIPPLRLGQYRIYSYPDCFVSWGNFKKEAIDGFLSRTRKLQPEDWNAGDVFFFIDFICPEGGVLQRMRQIKESLPNVPEAYYARSRGTGRVQKIGRFWQ